jgi:nucleoside-diphosphate-sugar epimerase
MKIVVLGANGQVGAELCLMLADLDGIELVPVSRTRNGSAFLRSHGVAVWHGDPCKADEAARIFEGADIIANFALAGGAGRKAREANEAIIAAAINHSPASAKQIFFSTLAVHGDWDDHGQKGKHSYGRLKLSNEGFFERLCRQQKRQGWIFRLGHVCGRYQGLTQAIQDELRRGAAYLPDPDRASNTICVAAIVDAIVAVGEARDAPPGRYDLVNRPQWSWRDVYYGEAEAMGAEQPLLHTTAAGEPPRPSAKARIFGLIGRLGLRSALERMLPLFPASLSDQIRADFMVSRTAGEIAALNKPVQTSNSAAWWPELAMHYLPGQAITMDLLHAQSGVERPDKKPWPLDLGTD